jgi:nicotinate-nucleotide pyrophosphorylase (carboxylating)
MKTPYEIQLDAFIDNALREDVGDGDHTSISCIPSGKKGKAMLLVKEKGIIAGIDVAEVVFRKIDEQSVFEVILTDGSLVSPGDIAFYITGNVRDILKVERLVLNIMQRMSGIATQTERYVSKLHGLKTRVMDTRKTTPGMRFLEKEAVRIGGGENHRMGLYDMIMIKDNHIHYSGSIKKALDKAHKYLADRNLRLKIEIEAHDLNAVHEILDIGGIDRILLDNFTVSDTEKAVELINGRIEIESSGGITLETIRDYAECGVDFISIGAMTHQIKSLNLSLKAIT